MMGKSGIKEEIKCKREEECKVLRGVSKGGEDMVRERERNGEGEGEREEREKEGGREGGREREIEREGVIWGRGRERGSKSCIL